MYGPDQNPITSDPSKTIPPTSNSNVVDISTGNEINGLTLQHVELEILLSMKIDYGLSFDQAVVSAMAHTGYEFLFSFPKELFPVECSQVSCIRMRGGLGKADSYLYIYQEKDGGRVDVADVSTLGEEFSDFARSFAGVISQISTLDSMLESTNTSH